MDNSSACLATILKIDVVVWCLIIDKFDPEQWYNLSLTCKGVWLKMRKALLDRKQKYIEYLRQIKNDHKLDLSEKAICLRPIMKLQPMGESCNGEISRHLCYFHRTGNMKCVTCKKNDASVFSFSGTCDSEVCRDYIFVYYGGRTHVARGYVCITCIKKNSDSPNSECASCSKKKYKMIHDSKPNTTPIYCRATTQSGSRCSKTTHHWSGKCTFHSAKKDFAVL